MSNKNGHDVENKYKDATEKFLTFMKETRQKEKTKQIEEVSHNDATTNVTNIVYGLSTSFLNLFNKINYWVDVMLGSSKRIKILSLFLTLCLCYFVNGGSGITTTKSIDYINEVPVEIKVKEGYEVINYDETVTIQLIGDFGSIQWAKIMDDYKIVLDVENKTEGNYDVNYTIEGISSNLDVQILPEKTNVNISKIETRSFALGFQFINQDKLDSAFILKDPKLAFLEVDVTAGTTTLERIASVVANIDVAEITSSVVDQKATISAIDINGNVLDVVFSDTYVNYDLDVISYKKTVPIQLVPIGEVNSGYVLTELIPSIQQVTIYGLEADLNEIDYVVAKVDIDGKAGNTTVNAVAIELPDTITKSTHKTLSVDIVVDTKITKEIVDIPINLVSLPSDLNAKLIGKESATIKVTGAKSKIDTMTKDTMNIYIDLTNATIGTSKHNLIIANQDKNVTYEFVDGADADVAITGNS